MSRDAGPSSKRSLRPGPVGSAKATKYASIAQLAEHLTVNQRVTGSSPVGSAKAINGSGNPNRLCIADNHAPQRSADAEGGFCIAKVLIVGLSAFFVGER